MRLERGIRFYRYYSQNLIPGGVGKAAGQAGGWGEEKERRLVERQYRFHHHQSKVSTIMYSSHGLKKQANTCLIYFYKRIAI